MNERIEELAIQAGGVWSGGYVEQANGNSVWTDKKFVEDVDTEYFAKLIVRKCAEFARQHNLEKADRSHMIHKAIKQHFGVEE